MHNKSIPKGTLFLTVFLLSSCGKLSFMMGPSPYERYKDELQKSGLHQTALVQDWIKAGTTVFSDTSVQAKPPFKGIFYFNPAHPRAASCVFDAKQGQAVTVAATGVSTDSLIIFVDLFKAEDTSKAVSFMREGEDSLEYKVKRTGQFLLRIQPELLRGGKVIVDIVLRPQLAFPVQNGSNKNIQSFFGAPREAGARSHEGIDIFAARGTPVLAPAPGRIVSVRTNRLGGKVVSQWDTKRNITYYFAHLSKQIAHTGERVVTGDTIGLVGNTGNAITTPPHLHFGIYTGKGAIDPQDYIYRTDTIPPALQINKDRLGQWASYRKGRNHFPVKLIGGSKKNYFARIPDSSKIVADKRYVEPITASRTIRLAQLTEVKEQPKAKSTAIATLNEGQQLHVLGHYRGFYLIRTARQLQGWIQK